MYAIDRHCVILAAVFCFVVSVRASADPVADFERGRREFARDDVIAAMHWLRRAAQADYTPAQTLLGYILDRAEQDDEAVQLFSTAAAKGDPDAMHALAGMYAAGEGVAKDEALAVSWYRRAVTLEHGPSTIALAEALLNGGLGLQPNRAAAIELLSRASERGYGPAKQRLLRVTENSQ